MIIRNKMDESGWTLEKVSGILSTGQLDCGDADLNEYFRKDCLKFREALLTQSYILYETVHPEIILGAVDFCNDALPKEDMSGNQRRKIPNNKRGFETYPAVKITRLGIQKEFQGHKIGSVLIAMIKKFFLEDNRTGCRYLTVDAYRQAVPFYEKNGFHRALIKEDEDPDSATISLYFDLASVKL